MKWFRIAVSGQTTDGREIQREWIEQMADSYDPQKYGARINVEHFRGFFPDGDFGAYGDVVALKADNVIIDGTQKLALFAKIQPNDKLKQLNAKNQKIYTSVEIDTNFAGSGKAYLVGLAVTDSPASLGTEMLQFAATASINPLQARKLNEGNLFTASIETSFEFDDEQATDKPDGLAEQIFHKLKALFTDNLDKPADKPADNSADKSADNLDKPADKPDVQNEPALALSTDAIVQAMGRALQAHQEQYQAQIDGLQEKITALNELLDGLPKTADRPTQAGTPQAVLVDC
ncbi:GPO family capsid scaffolding protein [Moraxella sp. Pampa]|uniref:GPO family capsid scaffolding protein n=1 Tax=Moraxella sp. Pampa TaxID=3111978 RepID=UPI002B40207A|nr:GPO family capsid scaffolding protein [Moraxella sp. Pampa]